MRISTRRLRPYVCCALLAVLLCSTCRAAPIPDATLQKMHAEAAHCIARHMLPDQICLRLRRKFGYNVYWRSVFGDKGTDILVQVGDVVNTSVSFLATIGRVPYCGSARPCDG